MTSNTLGHVAHELRIMRGLSVEDVAKATAISAFILRDIEEGIMLPTMTTLHLLSECYGVDLYVYAWCKYCSLDRLPDRVQRAAAAFTASWDQALEQWRHDNAS